MKVESECECFVLVMCELASCVNIFPFCSCSGFLSVRQMSFIPIISCRFHTEWKKSERERERKRASGKLIRDHNIIYQTIYTTFVYDFGVCLWWCWKRESCCSSLLLLHAMIFPNKSLSHKCRHCKVFQIIYMQLWLLSLLPFVLSSSRLVSKFFASSAHSSCIWLFIFSNFCFHSMAFISLSFESLTSEKRGQQENISSIQSK